MEEPNHESKRLDALRQLRILDTESESDFDDIVKLASSICGTSVSLINLIDEKRHWFKARTGMEVNEISPEISFCTHTILQDEIMVVPDTREDIRFVDNPLVVGDGGIRFYAGIPLLTSDGLKLGTLCVIDQQPRALNEQQLFGLRILGRQVMKLMELKLRLIQLGEANQELVSNDDMIRTNLEYISELQHHLEMREGQYRELVEEAGDMIYELSDNGQFSYVNPAMEVISGYSKEELQAKTYWSLVHADYEEGVIEFYRRQRNARQASSYLEFPIHTKKGKEIWIGQNVTMLFDENDSAKVRAVARDITAIHKARLDLAESEQRFKSLAENAPVAIYQSDSNNHIVYCNEKWNEIFGINKEIFSADHNLRYVHEEDRHRVAAEFRKIFAERTSFQIEYRSYNPDKGVRWVIIRGTPIDDNLHAFSGYIGTVDDITEQKEAELRLEQSERQFRLLSENSQDLITIFDTQNRFQYLSPASVKVIGYKPEELVGTSAADLLHPDDRWIMADGYLERTMQGEVETPHFRLRRKDGTYIWIEAQSTPVRDVDGNIVGTQSSSRDVTSRKEAEIAMQLAKDRAEEATKAKSLFLSMMSHEIRTPMNAIIGLTHLLLEDAPRPDQLESLKLLKFSGENLLTIINDILDFSKIEAGKIVLEYIDFDLYTLLKNLKQMLDQRAQDKGIRLHYTYDGKVPFVVKGDPVRIGQIVTNLLGNAIKFTERGYVELSVTHEGMEWGKHRVRIRVKDTGIGIDPEKIQLVFESFSQAGSDTTRKFGGTGLGLSISKRLLNLMHTDIEVASIPGDGSEFSFRLLLEEGQLAVVHRKPVEDVTEAFRQHNTCVLVVDDNRVNQVVAVNHLKRWGIQTEVASNGAEAVEKVKSKKFQLVLMDLQMPEMDGYEATRQIRRLDPDPYFRNIPILALSASAMAEIQEKAMEYEMTDFISKPFQPDDLKEKIARYALPRTEFVAAEEPRTFDLYTAGDPEFRRELASVIIKNVHELQAALARARKEEDPVHYMNTVHKIRISITMLGNEPFAEVIEAIKDGLLNKIPKDKFAQLIESFNALCAKIISDLEEEMNHA